MNDERQSQERHAVAHGEEQCFGHAGDLGEMAGRGPILQRTGFQIAQPNKAKAAADAAEADDQ